MNAFKNCIKELVTFFASLIVVMPFEKDHSRLFYLIFVLLNAACNFWVANNQTKAQGWKFEYTGKYRIQVSNLIMN